MHRRRNDLTNGRDEPFELVVQRLGTAPVGEVGRLHPPEPKGLSHGPNERRHEPAVVEAFSRFVQHELRRERCLRPKHDDAPGRSELLLNVRAEVSSKRWANQTAQAACQTPSTNTATK